MKHPGRIHILRILDQHGDTEILYDPEKEDQRRDVDARFAELMKRGFVAFDVSTEPGRRIKRFDENATEIIITPRFAGG
jgi:hypothetical protein